MGWQDGWDEGWDKGWSPQYLVAGSWPDNPRAITNGILLGAAAHNQSASNYATAGYTNSETAAALNRKNWLTHYTWSPLDSSPASLTPCDVLLNGSLLGHECVPIVNIWGFGSGTAGWPAAGLAAFTNGSMDSLLATWAALFNALPKSPLFVRLFREMNGTNVIYGTNGVASGGGVNETPFTFIPAWRYIVNYFRARCPFLRFVWCPTAGVPQSTPSAARAMMRSTDWYPGNAYVDWVGVDAYVQTALFTPIATQFAPLYQALNPLNGLFAAAGGYGTNDLSNDCTAPSTTGWAGLGGGSVAADSTNFLYGSGGVSMTSTGVNSGATLNLTTNPVAGETWQVTVWVWCPAASVGKNLQVRLFDTTSGQAGRWNVNMVAGWQSIDFMWTIPAGSGAPNTIRCDLLSTSAQGTFSWTANNIRVFKVPAQASGSDGIVRPPLMVCESQVDISDPSRITHIQDYTSVFTGSPGVSALCFWDQQTGQQFAIQDTPAGWLADFQAVAGAAPFLGRPV